MVRWSGHGITIDREDGVSLVTLTGGQDAEAVEELRVTLDSLLTPSQVPLPSPTLVLVDLSEEPLVEGDVIDTILQAHHAAQCDPAAHLAVVVDSPDGRLAGVLRRRGLTRLVPTYGGRAVAIAAITNGGGWSRRI